MPFFKKYNGTTNVRLLRIERLTWTLIYGGLLVIVLGYFSESTQTTPAGGMYTGGALAVVVGMVLIVTRSRLREED
jgi:vacuolar-type H+-ATPase subunit I/STV1